MTHAGSGRMTVRLGRLADLPALVTIEERVFDSDRLSRRSLRRFLLVPTAATLVAETPATGVAGYAMIGFRRGSRAGRIFSLAMWPAETGRGGGRALLAGCEAEAWRRGCTRVQLEVRSDNRAAIALYERTGYAPFDRLDNYYEDGTTALRFAKAKSDRA